MGDQEQPDRGSKPSAAGIMRLAHRLFPHRQFYLRSKGSVEFFEFSATLQMSIAVGTLLVMLWVAYASVTVLFKQEILAAKDQRYANMQAAYEDRLSQAEVALQTLLSACRASKCDLDAAAARSRNPERVRQTLSALKLAPAPTPAPTKPKTMGYEPNAAYEGVATTWDFMKAGLEQLRWVMTRGEKRTVNDDTAFELYVGLLFALLGYISLRTLFFIFRLRTKKVSNKPVG